MRIYLYLLLLAFIFSACEPEHHTGKQSQNGVLDLSDWNFEKHGSVLLACDWEFYWNQLLLPAEIKNHETDKLYYSCPSTWNDYNYKNQLLNGQGYATFRLKIKLNKQEPILELDLPPQATAYRLFVNGKDVFRNGEVGKTIQTSKPCYQPGSLAIQIDSTVMEFVIHVSNFHHYEGGFWHSIALGSQRGVKQKFEVRQLVDIFLIGSILIMAIYHLGLYLMRRKMISALYFSIFCFVITLRVFITPNHFENYLFPSNWSFFLFLEIFSFLAALPFFFLYTFSLFGKVMHKLVIYLVFSVFILETIFILVTPTSIYLQAIPIFKLVLTVELFYFFYVLIMALVGKFDGSIIFSVGTFFLILAVLNDLAVGSGLVKFDYSIQYGLFAFIFSQAYLLSSLFSRTFNRLDVN